LRAQGGAVTVSLAAAGGDRLAARVTRESVQLLDLVPGREVLALFKATAVEMLAAGAEASGRNAIAGEVVRASRARTGSEVALHSAGGHSLVGFAAPGPDGGAGLRVGVHAVAVFDAAAVVIALAA
jgi:molybdate transport system regulatory protein